MDKVATGRAGSRGIEALVGTVLGGGAAVGAGAFAHKTKEPTEWTDEHGFVYGRPLTTPEKEQRRRFLARAALLGAGLGAGGSLVAGGVRRHLLARAERKSAPKYFQEMFQGFRNVARELEEQAVAPGPARARMAPLRASMIQAAGDKANLASNLVHRQDVVLKKALNDARKTRAKRPWGGLDWGVSKRVRQTGPKTPTKTFHPKATAVGRMGTHFAGLKSEHGLRRMPTTETKSSEKWFREIVEKLMEKRSEVVVDAFELEVDRIMGAA